MFTTRRNDNTDLFRVRADGTSSPRPVVEGVSLVGETADWSGDGRYLAYQSDESGIPQVYVISFPSGEGKWPVSKDGGLSPRWNKNGTEIFYLSGTINDRRLTVVPVSTRGVFRAGTPTVLFSTESIRAAGVNFDVTADGKRFVMVQHIADSEPSTITVVQNWYTECKDKQP
ncbi:MAG TPA: hypothetical protein DIT99_03185 [Candidatus Latescibacteria bacterium]|nr:hypothetical protein [Candidatus Latescibacterota bacterium]